jgi:hypothetical protein
VKWEREPERPRVIRRKRGEEIIEEALETSESHCDE